MHVLGKGPELTAGPGHAEGDLLALAKALHPFANLDHVAAVFMASIHGVVAVAAAVLRSQIPVNIGPTNTGCLHLDQIWTNDGDIHLFDQNVSGAIDDRRFHVILLPLATKGPGHVCAVA